MSTSTLTPKIILVRQAVQETYDEMPETFSAFALCIETRRRLGKMTMDGTILRRLRELRTKGVCPYKVKDQAQSIYQKV